ncbi:NTP transferase domain-containing protein, partial [Candidatus Bathyarchaeota archaeon]|nr:NTP transferase domain-containing protein [Candidatus Bathyarchaeota archaeon]
MKAVILAAGEGSRLRPLTLYRPKCMIPLAGKPILEHLLLALKENGIEEILIIIGYRKELVRNYFRDGKDFGVKLSYIEQEKWYGTADAVSLSEEYVSDDDFLMLYGDLLIDASVVKITRQKYAEKGLITLTLTTVEEINRYGIVKIEKDQVLKIVEKPKSKEFGNLANVGVYIFSKKIFKAIQKTVKSQRKEFEITDTLNLLLKEGVSLASVEIEPRNWLDVGRPWDLLEANRRALKQAHLENKGELEKGAYLKGPVGVGTGTKIRSGAYIEGPVWIGEGSDIGPNCYIRPFTSLGKGVRIGNACEIKNSLILNQTHIGHMSYVGDSIVGEMCNFGAGTITSNLRFDDIAVKVKVKG